MLENEHPSTPLVNAGAIAACSMVEPTGISRDKWSAIISFIEALCGSKVDVIDAYTFMNRAECGAKWRDGIHFQPAASTALGRKIAETIEPALARTGEQKGASGHDQK